MQSEIQNPFDILGQQLAQINHKLDAMAQANRPEPEKKFYPVAEAAQRLGIAPITIYRNIESGKIPAKKIGSRLLIPGSFIDGNHK